MRRAWHTQAVSSRDDVARRTPLGHVRKFEHPHDPPPDSSSKNQMFLTQHNTVRRQLIKETMSSP
jgi:hypothetical protein